MFDNFQNHYDDWSRVPRLEALRDAPIRLDRYYTAQMYAEPPVRVPVMVVTQRYSVGVAYLLWLLLGLIGAHYFYMGKIGVGVLYLLTGGLLGVGWFIDLFTLKGQVERLNRH